MAVATAQGRAGVAGVRISGPQVPAISRELVATDLPPRKALLRAFLDAEGEPIDTGLVLFFPAPASYTGEDVLLDLRQAQLAVGDNQGFVIANGMLDLFAAGETSLPQIADQNSAPLRIATPAMPTPTSIPSPTAPPATLPPAETPPPPTPTLLPLPPESQPPAMVIEPTPLVTPDPAEFTPTDPTRLRWMIIMGFVILAVVTFGIWRRRNRWE